MERQKHILWLGAAVLLAAALFRLAGTGFFRPLLQTLNSPEGAAFLLYLETGRYVDPQPPQIVPATVPAQTEPQPTEPANRPVFTAADTDLVRINYQCSYRPDIGALLETPLQWDLRQAEPTVLILHTHTTESYTPTAEDAYTASGSYRTFEETSNMVAIGARVAQVLEEGGIRVVHAQDIHDYPSYSGSYVESRETALSYLAQYPTIRLVLDLHRDAAEDSSGRQVATSAQVDGQDAAQLMFVMGSDAGGLRYPNWQENLSLAVKLQAQLERMYPGLCRRLRFCSQRYNQDLLPGALLVEVGAAGNTRQQALVAAQALAEGILALAGGAGSSE